MDDYAAWPSGSLFVRSRAMQRELARRGALNYENAEDGELPALVEERPDPGALTDEERAAAVEALASQASWDEDMARIFRGSVDPGDRVTERIATHAARAALLRAAAAKLGWVGAVPADLVFALKQAVPYVRHGGPVGDPPLADQLGQLVALLEPGTSPDAGIDRAAVWAAVGRIVERVEWNERHQAVVSANDWNALRLALRNRPAPDAGIDRAAVWAAIERYGLARVDDTLFAYDRGRHDDELVAERDAARAEVRRLLGLPSEATEGSEDEDDYEPPSLYDVARMRR